MNTMDNSKKFVKEHGGNFITFEMNVPVTVKLLGDKEVNIPDRFKGGEVLGMRYLVEVNGEQTTFQTAGITLISKLAVCGIGDVVTIKKVMHGAKTSYEVTKDGQQVGSIDDDRQAEPSSKELGDVEW